uniref:protein LYRIC isoform X2 n=1 Tax=Myxine glutinosa TaxID=7769 RepID=UPI00358FA861
MSNAWHFEPWLRSLDDFLLSVIGPLGPSTFSAIVTAHRPPGLLFLVVVVLAVLFVLCLSRCARSLLSWKSTEVEPDGRIWTSGPGDASVAGEAKKRRRRDKGSKTETPFAAEAKQKANGISTVTSGNCVVKTGLGQASRHPEDFLIGEKPKKTKKSKAQKSVLLPVGEDQDEGKWETKVSSREKKQKKKEKREKDGSQSSTQSQPGSTSRDASQRNKQVDDPVERPQSMSAKPLHAASLYGGTNCLSFIASSDLANGRPWAQLSDRGCFTLEDGMGMGTALARVGIESMPTSVWGPTPAEASGGQREVAQPSTTGHGPGSKRCMQENVYPNIALAHPPNWSASEPERRGPWHIDEEFASIDPNSDWRAPAEEWGHCTNSTSTTVVPHLQEMDSPNETEKMEEVEKSKKKRKKKKKGNASEDVQPAIAGEVVKMETAFSTRQKDPVGLQSQTVGGAPDTVTNQTATSSPHQPEGKKKKKKQEVSALNVVKEIKVRAMSEKTVESAPQKLACSLDELPGNAGLSEGTQLIKRVKKRARKET